MNAWIIFLKAVFNENVLYLLQVRSNHDDGYNHVKNPNGHLYNQ